MKRTFLCLLIALLCLTAASAGADVIINEIMTNNGVFIDGERYDWIELYNNGSKAVDLTGYGLSDSKKKPMQWTFPAGAVLKAGEYAVIYCTGEEGMTQSPKRNVYYAPFKLSDDGENILLSSAAGEQLDLVKYPQQYGNITYGISASTGEWGFFDAGTPKARNGKTVCQDRAERPMIETAAGFYTLGKGRSSPW